MPGGKLRDVDTLEIQPIEHRSGLPRTAADYQRIPPRLQMQGGDESEGDLRVLLFPIVALKLSVGKQCVLRRFPWLVGFYDRRHTAEGMFVKERDSGSYGPRFAGSLRRRSRAEAVTEIHAGAGCEQARIPRR